MMRPNWINPPKIEKCDPSTPLIEQVEEMYWEPHDQLLRHCFNLSRWHVGFNGKLTTYMTKPRYAHYDTDIFDESNYPRYSRGAGNYGAEIWNESTPELRLRLADLETTAYVGLGENRHAIVGIMLIKCHVFRVRPKEISGFDRLLDINQLKNYILHRIENEWNVSEEELVPKVADDIDVLKMKGRNWAHIAFGRINDLGHSLYTALDDQHFIVVNYLPEFWSQDCTEISKKAYDISLTPLWDFMDNFTLEEIAEGDNKNYLTGQFEPKDKETFRHPGEDDNNSFEW